VLNLLTREFFNRCNISHKSKVAVVSHNDLDGVGPVIIARNYFEDCKYFTVSNLAVDKTVKLVLFSPDYEDREIILITDCSVSDANLISYINAENNRGKRMILLFDHHGTALALNNFDWAVVTQEKGVSGTKLLWKYMEEDVLDVLGTEKFLKLDNLVNKISDYDTWQWVEKNDRDCYNLHDLYSNTGVEYMLSKYLGDAWNTYNEFELFNTMDRALMFDYARKMEFTILPAIKRSSRIMDFEFEIPDAPGKVTIHRKKVKCATISCPVGELAEKLYEDGIDYIVFFYHDTISVRARVDDLDLGAWAKHMGDGGGHRRAAGFPMNKNNFYLYKNYLFNKFEVEENLNEEDNS
jgi:oligoribonuclease NrnB/cAMP/cGMP phosphodiesterase (DHH superfamily)